MDRLKKIEPFLLPVFWGLTGLLILKSFLVAMYDPDFWWHLAMGREMVEKHHFLRTEVFSHTLNGQPWTNFEWLFQIGAYLIYRAGGLTALYWTKIFFSLAVVGTLIGLLRTAGLRGSWLLALTWLGYLVLRLRLFERTELITLLFLPLFLTLILKIRDHPEWRPRSVLAAFFLLMVVWANAHGGFVYGAALIVCSFVGLRWSRAPKESIQVIDRSLLAVLLAVLITPFGWSIGGLIVELMMGFPEYKAHIQEWISPTVRDFPMYWILYGTVLASLVGVAVWKKKRSLFWIPATAIFSLWSASSVRNTVLLVFPALCFFSEVFLLNQVSPRKTVLGWLAVVALIVFAWPPFHGWFPRQTFSDRMIPRGAMEFVQRTHITGTLYNSYEFGGYLDWAMGPGRNIFFDGRYLFFPLAMEEMAINIQLRTHYSLDAWARFLDRHQIDYAVVSYPILWIKFLHHNGPEMMSTYGAQFPRADWALLYWDDSALVFVKRIPRFEPLILSREYKVVRPYHPDQMRYLLKAGLIKTSEMKSELYRQRNEVGPTRIGENMEKILNSFNSAAASTESGSKTSR